MDELFSDNDNDSASEPTPPMDNPGDLPRWPITRKVAGRKWPKYLPAKRRDRWARVKLRNRWPMWQ